MTGRYRRQSGQNLVEYALLIATVAILVLVGGAVFGGQLQTWFMQIIQRIVTPLHY